MNIPDLFTGAGGGAVIVGIAVAVIQWLSKRGTEQATATKSMAEADQLDAAAAEVLTSIATKMTADIRADYLSLRDEMRELKAAVEGMTHAVEAAIPLLEQAGHVEVVTQIRDARENVRRIL